MPSNGKGEPESASASRSAGAFVRERVHGGVSIAAGVGAVALAVAVAAGLVPIGGLRPGEGEWGRIGPLAFAALTAVSGLGLVASGAGAMRRASRRRRLLAERPWEPWMADHPWSREGTPDETGEDAARAFTNAARSLLAAVLAAGAFIRAAGAGGGPWRLLVPAALVALPLFPAAQGARLLARRARHGRVELRFARFPFFLGEAVEADLVRPPGGPALGKVRARLCCIQEQVLGRGRGSSGRAEEVLHDSAVEVECGHGGQLRIPLRFALPSDPALSTDLASTPRQFWRLEVAADAPGIDLGSRFLVPVYARGQPGAGTGSPPP